MLFGSVHVIVQYCNMYKMEISISEGVYTRTRTRTHAYTHTHAHARTHTHAHKHKHMRSVCVCVCTWGRGRSKVPGSGVSRSDSPPHLHRSARALYASQMRCAAATDARRYCASHTGGSENRPEAQTHLINTYSQRDCVWLPTLF